MSITRHPYYQEGGEYKYETRIELPGFVTEVVFAGYLEILPHAYAQFDTDPTFIKGCNASFKVYKDILRFAKIER